MQLSIIIVNFNVKHFLEQCLYSVLNGINNISAEIWVIDNASTDGSKTYFENRFPNVNFIWQAQNIGFGKANNEVLKRVTGELVLFLNPDTLVAEDSFQICINHFHTNPSTGGVGVHMIDGSGNYLPESKRGFPGPFTSFCKLSGLTALFPHTKGFANYYLGHLSEKQNQVVEVLSGAFMMVRKKLLDDIGGFDEQFFMYGEDIDLSYRITQAGYQNVYLAETTIVHFKGESTQKQNRQYVANFYGAMLLFVKKHLPLFTGFVYALLLRTVIFIKKISQVLSGIWIKKKQISFEHWTNLHNWMIVADQQNGTSIQQAFGAKHVNNQHVASIEQLSALNIDKDSIIFCTSAIRYQQMFSLMQQWKGKTRFFFHAANSNCVIGSSDKNKNGMVILV
ncbi:MAG: hypothetical protein RLY16_2320 [Bacteroidota bacterium]